MTNHIIFTGDTTGHEKLIAHLKESFANANNSVVHEALTSALPEDTLWRRHREFGVTHLTDDGDLVLDIRDLFATNGFWNHDLLRIWAMFHSFNLHGWNDTEMHWRMFEWTLFPAVAELDNGEQLIEAFQTMLVGGSVPSLPDFRILVNGQFLMKCLVHVMDGPFESDEDLHAATRVRSTGYRPSDKSPLPYADEAT